METKKVFCLFIRIEDYANIDRMIGVFDDKEILFKKAMLEAMKNHGTDGMFYNEVDVNSLELNGYDDKIWITSDGTKIIESKNDKS